MRASGAWGVGSLARTTFWTPYPEDWKYVESGRHWFGIGEVLGTDAVCRVHGSPGGQPFILSVPRYAAHVSPFSDRSDLLPMPQHVSGGDEHEGSALSGPNQKSPLTPSADPAPVEHLGHYKPGEMLVKTAFLDEPSSLQKEPPCPKPAPPGAFPVLLGRTLLHHSPMTNIAKIPESTATGQSQQVSRSATSTLEAEVSWNQQLAPRGLSLGSPDCPTSGSRGHHFGQCKPCAFVFKGGCSNGVDCRFCHLCMPGEKKRRKKERKAIRREMAALRGMGMGQRNSSSRK